MTRQLICFDLDGTLVDTAPEISYAANQALQAHGLPPCPEEQVKLLIGGGTRELMLKLLARLFIDQPSLAERARPQDVLASMEAYYGASAGTTALPYPGCAETLSRLRFGGIKLACVTNKEIRYAVRILNSAGLADQFGLVVGGDTLAEKKPHRLVLREVVRRLGATMGTSAHVGDSAIDIAAARNAGVAAWCVPYGYNAGIPIADEKPDLVFSQLEDIADYVLRGNTRSGAATESDR